MVLWTDQCPDGGADRDSRWSAEPWMVGRHIIHDPEHAFSDDCACEDCCLSSALDRFHLRVEAEMAAEFKCPAATQTALEGMVLLLRLHRAPKTVVECFFDQVEKYLLDSVGEQEFIRRLKYLQAYPMARYLRNDLPQPPDVIYIWSGCWRRWARSRLQFCSRNTHLWYSFFQCKRCAAPVSEDYVKQAYRDHRAQMAEPDPITDDLREEIVDNLQPLLQYVRDRVKIPRDYTRDGPETSACTWSYVSTHACFEESRSGGGQRGYLCRRAFGRGSYTLNPTEQLADVLDDVPIGDTYRPSYGLTRMDFVHRAYVNGVLHVNQVISLYDVDEDDLTRFVASALDAEQNFSPDVIWGSLENPQTYTLQDGRLPAMIKGIIEPLKVRVISKGPAAQYYLSKRVQVAIHSVLRQLSCFSLIGRPISAFDLIDLQRNQCRLDATDERVWCSIDYKGATDGLSASLSASLLAAILPADMLEGDRVRAMKVLAPHTIFYPGSQILPVEQNNGQLMGSILSFVILCLANLGVYVTAMRRSGDRRSFWDLVAGVRVNGDDMLYIASPTVYRLHESISSQAGLKFSVGKSFFHHTFANANSTCYHASLDQTPRFAGVDLDGCPRQIPFFNTGLFFLNRKVMSITDEDSSEARPSTLFNKMLDGCYSASWEKPVASMFLARHQRALQAEARGRNYFVHPNLGGLGMRVPTGWKWTANLHHHMLAYERLTRLGVMHEDGIKSIIPTCHPLPSPTPRELFTHARVPWDDTLQAAKAAEFVEEPRKNYCPAVSLKLGAPPVRFLNRRQRLSKIELVSGFSRVL